MRPHSAFQWNPPKEQRRGDASFHAEKDVQSATECTGLLAHPPQSEDEAHELSAIYSIHEMKPQGNIGKDNPRNDPSERAFHRS